MAGEQIRMTPMGGVKAFNCRNCGGQVTLLAPGQTIAAACKHCGAVADLTDDNFRILSKVREMITREPRYAIGSKATFEGKTWVVIGFMARIVREYHFEWEEYLLFNPYHGFRFLAHAYGHWSWIKMIHDGPLGLAGATHIRYQKQDFKFLTQGEAEVFYVLGEFYWQVKVGDKAQTRDLVAAPRMLSVELEEGGLIWSLGEYMDPQLVERAFGAPPQNKVRRIGVGANQPNPHKANLRWVIPTWIASMVLAIVLFFVTDAALPNQSVLQETRAFPDSTDHVSGPFEIGNAISNVEVQLRADSGLDNHWVEFQGVLHNLETNENYEFVAGAEYYFGYTDGENWTEGSKLVDVVLNEVPAGNYEMVTSSLSDSVGTATITVVRGAPIYTNVLGLLLLLSLAPMFVIIRSAGFEKQRNG
jgi:hypothetical protein